MTNGSPSAQRLGRILFSSSPIVSALWYCTFLQRRYYQPSNEPVLVANSILGLAVEPVTEGEQLNGYRLANK